MPPRQRIDRYEIDGVIGHGSMGVVYRARDPVIGRELAVKTIRLPESGAAATPESQERFARELRAAGVLSHPNIVTVYDAGNLTGDAAAYMAMEYVEGRSLRERIRPGERMRSEDALELAMQVARALDYAHSRGIVHRDVKPGNILIRDDGLAKLADFGIAQFGPSDITKEGSVGSPSYVAPEVLRGEPLDGRADLFSLGVVLYEILTGVRPFQSETLPGLYHQILSAAPSPPRSIGHEVPPEWDAVIIKLLAKRPSDRYQDAGELLADLRRLERGLPPLIASAEDDEATLTEIDTLPPLTSPHIRSGPPASPEGPWHGSVLVSIAPLALLAVAVAVGIFIFDRQGTAPPPIEPIRRMQPVAPPMTPVVPRIEEEGPGPEAPAPDRPLPPPPARSLPAPAGRPQRAAAGTAAAAPTLNEPPPVVSDPVPVAEERMFVEEEEEAAVGEAEARAPRFVELATLSLGFEHTLEVGRFILLVDGKPMFSESIEPFAGRRKSPPRTLTGSVSVGAGHHVVVAVARDDEGREWRDETGVVLEPGQSANLSIALRGPLKKRLRIEVQ